MYTLNGQQFGTLKQALQYARRKRLTGRLTIVKQ
jgi:hypothetical protein